MNLYKSHTDREILTILEESGKLTYDAQRNLLKELNARSLGVATTHLEKLLQEKEIAIRNLDYLKELGFTYHKDNSTGLVTVRRATSAKVMDIVSIVVGGVLFIVGLIYFWLLVKVFFGDNEFTLGGLLWYVLVIAAGLIGFRMLGGIHRFLDYKGFSLTKSQQHILIRKGGVAGEQNVSASELKLEEQEDELILMAGDIEIMRSTENNLVHKTTLESLLQILIANR